MKRKAREVYTFADDGEKLKPKPFTPEETKLWDCVIKHVDHQLFNDNQKTITRIY